MSDPDRKLEEALNEFRREADKLKEAARVVQERLTRTLTEFAECKQSKIVPTLKELSEKLRDGHRLEIDDEKEDEVTATFVRAPFRPEGDGERKPSHVKFVLDRTRGTVSWSSTAFTRGGSSASDTGSVPKIADLGIDRIRATVIDVIAKSLGT